MSFYKKFIVSSIYILFNSALPSYPQLENQAYIDWNAKKGVIVIESGRKNNLNRQGTSYEAHKELWDKGRLALLQAIYQLAVDSEDRVEDKIKNKPLLRKRLQTLAFYFQKKALRRKKDGYIDLVLSYSFLGEKGLYALLSEKSKFSSLTPKLKIPPKEASYPPIKITSLILSISSLDKKRYKVSLKPKIYSREGLLLYSEEGLKNNCAIKNGMIHYFRSIEEAKNSKEAGEKPYFAYVHSLRGKLKSDLVLGNQDAENILVSPSGQKTLENCKVFLVY